MRIDLLRWRTPLIVLGVFIVLQGIALWLFATASDEAHTARRQLIWMQKQQDVVSWITHKPDSAALNIPLTQAVTESATRAGIALSSPPAGGDTVQLTLSGIEFNLLIGWLQQMQQSAGVLVVALELTPAAPGEVNVSRLVLGRPPRAQ
ncbi:type II secretion system protein M [Pluralibacter gergoviae]